MKLLRRLLAVAAFAALLLLGALFAVQNTAAVPLNLLVVQLPERSVALWVLLAFAAGGVAGMVASAGMALRLTLALRRARRQLAQAGRSGPDAAKSGTSSPVVARQDNPRQGTADG